MQGHEMGQERRGGRKGEEGRGRGGEGMGKEEACKWSMRVNSHRSRRVQRMRMFGPARLLLLSTLQGCFRSEIRSQRTRSGDDTMQKQNTRRRRRRRRRRSLL
eukprot:762549-Hanusia_phi.AAC.1